MPETRELHYATRVHITKEDLLMLKSLRLLVADLEHETFHKFINKIEDDLASCHENQDVSSTWPSAI